MISRLWVDEAQDDDAQNPLHENISLFFLGRSKLSIKNTPSGVPLIDSICLSKLVSIKPY